MNQEIEDYIQILKQNQILEKVDEKSILKRFFETQHRGDTACNPFTFYVECEDQLDSQILPESLKPLNLVSISTKKFDKKYLIQLIFQYNTNVNDVLMTFQGIQIDRIILKKIQDAYNSNLFSDSMVCYFFEQNTFSETKIQNPTDFIEELKKLQF